MSKDELKRLRAILELRAKDGRVERFEALVRDDYSNKHAQLWLKRIDEAVKAEREACAKVCDDLDWSQDSTWQVATIDCAEAIRARNKE